VNIAFDAGGVLSYGFTRSLSVVVSAKFSVDVEGKSEVAGGFVDVAVRCSSGR
jgi:hypothetical protein